MKNIIRAHRKLFKVLLISLVLLFIGVPLVLAYSINSVYFTWDAAFSGGSILAHYNMNANVHWLTSGQLTPSEANFGAWKYTYVLNGWEARYPVVGVPMNDNYRICVGASDTDPGAADLYDHPNNRCFRVWRDTPSTVNGVEIFNIYGHIVDNNNQPLSGVSVSDGAGHTAITDSSGNYSFRNLNNGSYTLTPSKANYAFSPASRGASGGPPYNVSGQDFSGTSTIFSISGSVTSEFAVPIPGVAVTDGAGHTAYTDGAGNYTFTNLTAGSYTLTPSKSGYLFRPTSQVVSGPPSVTGQNFLWVAPPAGVRLSGPFELGLAQRLADTSPITDELPANPSIYLAKQTFDPLQTVPASPNGLAYTVEEVAAAGVYLVQFNGPILPEWKDAIVQAGGQLADYIPDYAFITHLDEAAKAQVEALPYVRWIGPYQPAYKLAANVTYTDTRSYRVTLAPWANEASRNALQSTLPDRVDYYEGGFTAILKGSDLDPLAQSPAVLWIEPYELPKANNDIGGGTIMGGSVAWSNGYTGTSTIVAIADTGLDTGNAANIHQDFAGRVAHISSWPVQNYSWDGCVSLNVGADDGAADVESGHGTHVTGSVAGNGARSGGQFKGLAYGATIVFQALQQKITWSAACSWQEDYKLAGIPPDEGTLLKQAYDWGARIHNNSWGAPVAGAYNITARNFDNFISQHRDMAVVVSAGNDGVDGDADGYVDEGSVGSPGTAKNVITVGASENERASGGCSTCLWEWWESEVDGSILFPEPPTGSDRVSSSREHMAAFSSRGPTSDGRIKPDVVAPGTDIVSTLSSLATSDGWGPYNQYYMYMGGTSMSSPLTAGAAAVVRDYYVKHEHVSSPSAALIKATLINTAVDISGYGNSAQEAGQPIPNMHEGWGRVNVGAATTPGSRQFIDQTSGLGTAGFNTYLYSVNVGQPFKVTLVWSDVPGTPMASKELVNDLNLRITAPNGTIYRGNNFSGGWSQVGGSADSKNNVENVYIQSPAVGLWKVEVIGQNVPSGPQPYALVINGDLDGPATGKRNIPYSFIATMNPTVTTPLTYTWQATDYATPIVWATTQRADMETFTWSTLGQKVITLTVSNQTGSVSDIITMKIETQVYLPVALKN